jgi:hypothetical protein
VVLRGFVPERMKYEKYETRTPQLRRIYTTVKPKSLGASPTPTCRISLNLSRRTDFIDTPLDPTDPLSLTIQYINRSMGIAI